MSNTLTNHVDPKRSEAQQDLMALLRGEGQGQGGSESPGGNVMADVQRLYAPVLALMGEGA